MILPNQKRIWVWVIASGVLQKKKKKKNKYTEDKKGLFGSIFLIWVSNIIFLL